MKQTAQILILKIVLVGLHSALFYLVLQMSGPPSDLLAKNDKSA